MANITKLDDDINDTQEKLDNLENPTGVNIDQDINDDKKLNFLLEHIKNLPTGERNKLLMNLKNRIPQHEFSDVDTNDIKKAKDKLKDKIRILEEARKKKRKN